MRLEIIRQKVWHVPRMEELELCAWVDTDTQRYACYCCAMHAFLSGDDALVEEQAKKIVHYPNKNLVLIDPIEDSEPDREPVMLERHDPADYLTKKVKL